MTIYDTLLANLKANPELKCPVWIAQIRFYGVGNWEAKRKQYYRELREYEQKHAGEGKYIILNCDTEDLSITVITDDDKISMSIIKQPACVRILRVSSDKAKKLWEIAKGEADQCGDTLLSELKDGFTLLSIEKETIDKLNRIIETYRSILKDPDYNSIDLHRAIAETVNEFRFELDKDLIKWEESK